jgi:hypothetical protein
MISANREKAKYDPRSNNTSVHQASKQQQQMLHQYHLDRNFNHHFQLHQLQHSNAHFSTSHQQQQL